MKRGAFKRWSDDEAEYLTAFPPLVPSGSSPQISLDSFNAVQLFAARWLYTASVAVGDRFPFISITFGSGLEWKEMLPGPIAALEAKIVHASRNQTTAGVIGTFINGVISGPIIENPNAMFISAQGIDVADVISGIQIYYRGWRNVGS